jgi:hypothetical protein
MAGPTHIGRTRRSLFRAAAIAAGAVIGSTVAPRRTQAQWWCWWCSDTGGGTGGGTSGPCFLRGTGIRTPTGYRAIEELGTGDLVTTRFAGVTPIREVSSFTMTRSGPERTWEEEAHPVRVKAGALGEGAPFADLVLTASHAVFTGGVLVPVGDLVNGTSIVLEQAYGRETLDFFHIELDRHDVLEAEGAPCESLREPELGVESCVPLLGFHGRREQIRSRLRSAASLIVDRRRPLDIVRDELEERGARLASA